MSLPLESVPNFSEGRDRAVIDEIAAALGRGARLLDLHSDPDHNRSVYTLVGTGDELVEALVAGVAAAVERIDLRAHTGTHPRVGAADVVPLVFLRPDQEPDAREAALAVADRLAADLELPVFFYGRLTDDGREPSFYRRGGLDGLAGRLAAGEVVPDRGPATLHPSAGAALVGVRRPLIAFNVNLRTRDVEVARRIARTVRERDGGFRGVRALGLELAEAGLVQVSMNVTDWEAAAVHEIVARVADEAATAGVEVSGSELVGLMPAGAAVAAAGRILRLEGFDATHVLELRLLEGQD